jgi:hypothetical protein
MTDILNLTEKPGAAKMSDTGLIGCPSLAAFIEAPAIWFKSAL